MASDSCICISNFCGKTKMRSFSTKLLMIWASKLCINCGTESKAILYCSMPITSSQSPVYKSARGGRDGLCCPPHAGDCPSEWFFMDASPPISLTLVVSFGADLALRGRVPRRDIAGWMVGRKTARHTLHCMPGPGTTDRPDGQGG